MKIFVVISIVLLSFASFGEETIEEYYTDNCVDCHSGDGATSLVPVIDGIKSSYIKKHLKAFAKDKRKDMVFDEFMNFVAKELSSQQIRDLGVYVSELNVCHLPKEMAPEGKDLEAAKTKIEAGACLSCHTKDGSGSGPRIAGQKYDYLVYTLGAFKDGTRKNPIMADIASELSPEDIENVSAYFTNISVCE